MKKISILSLLAFTSASVWAHAGHSHNHMSHNELIAHILWIGIPAIAFIIGLLLYKKKKSAKQNS